MVVHNPKFHPKAVDSLVFHLDSQDFNGVNNWIDRASGMVLVPTSCTTTEYNAKITNGVFTSTATMFSKQIYVIIGVNSFSWCFWVKVDSISEGAAIIDGYENAGICGGFFFNLTSESPGIFIDSDDCDPYINFPANMSPDFGTTWHFLAITFDPNGVLKVYVDGNLTAIDPMSGAFPQTCAFNARVILGQNAAGGAQFNGQIAQVLMYKKELSQDEVRNLYGTSVRSRLRV